MRKIKLAPGEYYHIYNRGNNKQKIFLNNKDYTRFLFLILYLQSPHTFPQVGRLALSFVKHRVFDIDINIIEKILKDRFVELVCYVLMPNHFHLIVHEIDDHGISKYMQRVLNAYSKYFNIKYDLAGHVFQGPFRAVHIKNNEQLIYLSAYIHRNPRELKGWKNKEDDYPWSSYNDYISMNQWNGLLKNSEVIEQFVDGKKYIKFVESTDAKEFN